MADISDKRVAILAADGFEQSELTVPKLRLEEAGAAVDIISLKTGEIWGWDHDDWGEPIAVDRTIDAVNIDEYDALVDAFEPAAQQNCTRTMRQLSRTGLGERAPARRQIKCRRARWGALARGVDRRGSDVGAHHHAGAAAGRGVVDRAMLVGGEIPNVDDG